MNKLTWRQRLALHLVPEYARLRDLCIDLNEQVTTLRATGGIDPDELKGYAEMRVQHTAMMERERELGVWLRDRFKKDIELGRHAGKSLVEVLQMHLNKTPQLVNLSALLTEKREWRKIKAESGDRDKTKTLDIEIRLLEEIQHSCGEEK